MNCSNCSKTDIENFENPCDPYDGSCYGNYYWCSDCGTLFFVGDDDNGSFTKIPQRVVEIEGGEII